MRAAVINGYGGSDRFEIREVDRPSPGPGQILVRVRAASVNPIDWKTRRGGLFYARNARFPLILGYDVAGEVEEVGPEVDRFQPGDPVYAYLDSPHGGAYAEYAVVGQGAAAPKPERLSFEEAAAVPLAGLTALQALRDKGELGEGERVLVNGASGGVGHFAVQIVKVLGARVVGAVSGRNQEFVRELGAERTIDYEQEDFTQDEDTFDVVLDTVGNTSLRDCDLILGEGGVFVTTVPGPLVFVQGAAAYLSSLFGPTRRARLVVGKPDGNDLALLARWIDQGKIRPVLQEVYPLEEIRQAHEASESGHARGKIVVRVG